MKFIVKKDSETGKQLQELIDRMREVSEQARVVAAKLGAESHRIGHFSLAGGISSLVFDKPQDPKLWKSYRGLKNEYTPKRNIKAGKENAKIIDALPVVEPHELNDILGFEKIDFFNHPGFNNPKDGDYFGIRSSDKWGMPNNKDLIEVTNTKYLEMFPEKKETEAA